MSEKEFVKVIVCVTQDSAVIGEDGKMTGEFSTTTRNQRGLICPAELEATNGLTIYNEGDKGFQSFFPWACVNWIDRLVEEVSAPAAQPAPKPRRRAAEKSK